jgi:transcriptional regulator with XRE-family HTH domain
MATVLPPVNAREVLRCDHCLLVQFRNQNNNCRRCRLCLDEPEPEPEPIPLTPLPPPQPVVSALAATIRSLRLRGGWSQRQLAKRFQPRPVPRTYISKIENGLDTPTIGTLERLARALEVTVSELVVPMLSGQESSRRDTIAALMNDPFVAEVAGFTSRLNAMQMSSVLAQVHDMAARQQRRSLARGPESAARTFGATA